MKKILASILALATLTTCVFTSVSCMKEAPVDSSHTDVSGEIENEGGMEVEDVTPTAGMSLKVVKMSYNGPLNPDTGIATAAEEGYQLTETVLPEDAADKTVKYSVAWSNADSTWANGKSVNDYVTVTQASEGALTATVTCNQAFGEPIIVTVTSNNNPNAKATATLHYKQKIASYGITGQGSDIFTDGVYYTQYGEGANYTDLFVKVGYVNDCETLSLKVQGTDVYTRENTEFTKYGYCELDIEATAEFEAVLTGLGIESAFKGEGNDDGTYFDDFLNNCWLDIYGSTPEKKNQIINAFLAFEGVAYTATVKDTVENVTVIFNISLDTSLISGQKQVESVTEEKVELEI